MENSNSNSWFIRFLERWRLKRLDKRYRKTAIKNTKLQNQQQQKQDIIRGGDRHSRTSYSLTHYVGCNEVKRIDNREVRSFNECYRRRSTSQLLTLGI